MQCIFCSHTCQKWTTITCLFLMTGPIGLAWYWGNLSVYFDSYCYKRIDTSSNIYAPWTMTFVEMSTGIGLLLSSYLSKTLGKRLTLTLGYSLITSGFIGAYFVTRHSGWATTILIGFGSGSGIFISNGVVMLITSEWADGDFGFLSSIVQCGRTMGAIAINQLITIYINPHNVSPDCQDGPGKIFTQNSLLNKVPTTFLFIGLIVLGLFVLTFPLVRFNTRIERERLTDSVKRNYEGVGEVELAKSTEGNNKINSDENKNEKEQLTQNKRQSFFRALKQLLLQPALYTFACYMMIGSTTYLIVSNYYKQYGQVYINDDHFLTDLSITYPIVLTISRLGWGKLLDGFGIKTTAIVYFSSNALASLGFYYSPWFGKWSYVIWTHIFFATGNIVYLICVYSCDHVFGKDNLIMSYGLLSLPPSIIAMGVSSFSQYLIEHFGWFALFAWCSSFNILGLIITVAGARVTYKHRT